MRVYLVLIIATFLAFQCRSEDVLQSVRFIRTSPVQLSANEKCLMLNTSCDACIQGTEGVSCYWCGSECRELAFSGITSGDCDLNDIKVGQCQLNGLAIIILSCGAVLVVLSLGCVALCLGCYCYCRFCRGERRARVTKAQLRAENEMNEIGERHSQKRAERQAKGDEMRRKYGLLSEDDKSGYQHL